MITNYMKQSLLVTALATLSATLPASVAYGEQKFEVPVQQEKEIEHTPSSERPARYRLGKDLFEEAGINKVAHHEGAFLWDALTDRSPASGANRTRRGAEKTLLLTSKTGILTPTISFPHVRSSHLGPLFYAQAHGMQ